MRRRSTRTLLFRVTDDALYVANFGRPFDRRGVISVCREHLSSKTKRGPRATFDDVADESLVDAIRESRLAVYEQELDQLQEDANQEAETGSDYAGRSQWELLQNADDALASASTSSADLIGAKGLGFKSVLEITDRPSVHSGHFDFGFDAATSKSLLERIDADAPALTFRLPHKAQRDRETRQLLAAGHATVVKLPFRSASVREDLAARLNSLDPHFLLLCRNLDTVVVERLGQPMVRLSVERPGEATLRNARAVLTVTTGDKGSSTAWRIWSSVAPAAANQEKSLSAAIAAPITDGLVGPGSVDVPVHVFFPTSETIGARFLVHGSFALTSNRNTLKQDPQNDLVRDMLQALVRQVIEDVPAAAAVRLFGSVVGGAKGGRARRQDRLVQQAIASAVVNAEFVPLIGGGKVVPARARTWDHGFQTVVPGKLGRENLLAAGEMAPVFGELRSPFDAQPLRAQDYADLLARTRAIKLDAALSAIRVCSAACLSQATPEPVLRALAKAQIWPTDAGAFRSLDQQPSLLRKRPEGWPRWLEAEALHREALAVLESYDAQGRQRWEQLLDGRLLRSSEDWIRHSLAPALGQWTGDDWQEHGFEALELIERWGELEDVARPPFVEKPNGDRVRAALAAVAKVPTRQGWVPAQHSYAGRELGAPGELAAYFRAVPDRHVVGAPQKALSLFGPKRWRVLLRYLGVSWEPKVRLVRRDGSLGGQPSYSHFRRALSDGGINRIDREWYIEHFPAALASLGALQVADCVANLADITSDLGGRWRKIQWADTTHAPSPFKSYADFQLRSERYLPQRMSISRNGERLAPHELFWPKRGIMGITPVVDLGAATPHRRARFKSVLVDRLGMRDSLPKDPQSWTAWSAELIERVRAGDVPSQKSIRDFYDALLRTFTTAFGPSRIGEVVAVRPGTPDDIIVVPSSEALWIDDARFENPDLHQALGKLGWAILPVRLERGKGAAEVLGVRRASDVLTVSASYEPASEWATTRLRGEVSARRGALAAICLSKNLLLRELPSLKAVQDLRLRISGEGHALGERSAGYYREGSVWLISLQAPDRWEAMAAALAEPFGAHAPDLKYRFAKVLRARRSEIAAILAEDGIPGYRIRDALSAYDEADDGENAGSDHEETAEPDEGPEVDLDPLDAENNEREEDKVDGTQSNNGDDQASEDRRGRPKTGATDEQSGDSHKRRRLTQRPLFGGGGANGKQRSRREAGEAAGAAARRGLQAEAWLLGQIATHVSPSWNPMANVRDESSRETDVLLARNGEEWHIEVKCLTGERLYWSELEREKAEQYPGRYVMALLTEAGDGGFAVRWSWDPLADLARMQRRIDWMWEGSSEGPSLRQGWTLEAGVRWPERRASRYTHVVRITQEGLDGLDEDGPGLLRLRERIRDTSNEATKSAA